MRRVENITEAGARRRLRMGIAFLVIGIGAAAWLLAADVSRWWRVLLLIPFGLAANGVLQAREKTCVVLGAIGKRETGADSHAAMAPEECEIVKRQVAAIVALDVAFAAAITAVVWVL